MKKIIFIFLFVIAKTASAQGFQNYNWTPLPFHDAYIDLSKLEGDKINGFKVVTLSSFDEISSSQMWGLSSIDELKINCNKGTFQYLKSTWTDKQMGKGKIAKVFKSPQKTPASIREVLDGTYQRDLFKYLCK